MRTERSIKNIIAALVSYLVTLVVGFYARKIFVDVLGDEYLGVNSLFANIISVMSVVELGFGSAIIYNLYRPLSENNKEAVKSLVYYYRRIYSIIALIVTGIGILIIPLIPIIVRDVSISDNLYIIFILFVVDAATSYLLTYKRSILYADQKNYYINITHAIMYASINIIQIITLLYYQNYYLFLVLQIILHIAENIIISIVANKKYPYLLEKNIQNISNNTKIDIINKVKGLFFHQIGSAIVMGTDNIIMSLTENLGIIAVGKYSNYVMVISNLNSLTSQVFTSVTSSVGNLMIEKDTESVYKVYKRILFLNAALCNFICVSLYSCFNPFISLWVGEKFLLPTIVVIVIVSNFYVQGMKRTCGIFKNAAGVFYEDRFVPLVEAIVNLVTSIALAYAIGLSGIILGTMISSMVHWFYDFPKYVYGKVLRKSIRDYIFDYLPYVLLFLFSIISIKFICNYIDTYLNTIFSFIVNVLICCVLPNLLFVCFFHRKEEYTYWKTFVNSIFVRLINRSKEVK